eukprot:gene2667-5560_t
MLLTTRLASRCLINISSNLCRSPASSNPSLAGVRNLTALQTQRDNTRASSTSSSSSQGSSSVIGTPPETAANASMSSTSPAGAHSPYVAGPEPTLPDSAKLDFSDPSEAFKTKSYYELVLAYVVLKLCMFQPLVQNSGMLYKRFRIYNLAPHSPKDPSFSFDRGLFGPRIVDGIIKKTFFRHFCAGENEGELRPKVANLRASGIGSIMDYAAEADLEDKPEDVLEEEQRLTARTYDYVDERHCDANVVNFKICIENVHNVSPAGIAAIKVTALGHPDLLKQLSAAIVQTQWLFHMFSSAHDNIDHPNDGLTLDDFRTFFNQYFPDLTEEEIHDFYNVVDSDKNGRVDYVEWTHNLNIEDIWDLLRRAGSHTPLAQLTNDIPTDRELQLLRNLQRRLTDVVEYAESHRVRLMIDAEQSYFQPIIDNLVLGLQRKYNKDYGLIYQTYQCYLKDTITRIEHDLERAQREGWWFAAKLVRGAYMEAERALAQQRGYADPIHNTIEDTHNAYNKAIGLLMDFPRCNILIASHNQYSVEYAVEEMSKRGIHPQTGGVCFAQLLGMSDHLTYTLGLNGYKAYKYVPYGPVNEVMPYLIRRAHENSSLLGGADHELKMIANELRRRTFKFQFA